LVFTAYLPLWPNSAPKRLASERYCASVFNLVYLLSSGVTRLILIAIVVAVPVSWYAVNKWLAGFAYHIPVSWVLFAGASLAIVAMAWLTVSYETIKAAIVNPIKSLRTE